MFRFDWAPPKLIQSKEDIHNFIQAVNEVQPNILAFDTETTGLNIVEDKPFLFPVALGNQKSGKAFSYTIDFRDDQYLAEQFVLLVWTIAKQMDYVVGHNIGFDLHMMHNFGIPYDGENLTDTTIMIRLGSDALTVRNGGESLSLTQYASKHIDKRARSYDRVLQQERSEIAKQMNQPLKDIARKHGYKWTEFSSIVNDDIYDISMLPEQVQTDYMEWYNSLPKQITHNMNAGVVKKSEVPYNMLSKDSLYEYAAYDAIYTLETFHVLEKIIKLRKNTSTWERENKLIPVLVRMERVGFKINRDYVESIKEPMRLYILNRRERFKELVKADITISQHVKMKEQLENVYGLKVQSTNKKALKDLKQELEEQNRLPEVVEMINIIQELRRLEKWYTTYLMRFYKEGQEYTNLYTQLNQAGAVTGRFTSDLQQMPSGSIQDHEGNDLFIPRKMITVNDEYDYLVFIDYSQIELRVQAFYTMLVGDPDLNLCRAYMPYKCYTWAGDTKGNVQFDPTNPEHVKNYDDYIWFHNEDHAQWHPVDVHAATTKEAFPDLDPNTDEFKMLRDKVGKPINFSKNYGASINVTREMFKGQMTEEEIRHIDGAYYRAFPGVRTYQKHCYNAAHQGYLTNLFGRRYYSITGHNGMNALIQGSSADLLKDRMIALDKYNRDNNLESKMMMTIHDEIVFAVKDHEKHHVDNWVKIMQDFKGSWVPIIAEIEYTDTTWDEVKEAHNAALITRTDKA